MCLRWFRACQPFEGGVFVRRVHVAVADGLGEGGNGLVVGGPVHRVRGFVLAAVSEGVTGWVFVGRCGAIDDFADQGQGTDRLGADAFGGDQLLVVLRPGVAEQAQNLLEVAALGEVLLEDGMLGEFLVL